MTATRYPHLEAVAGRHDDLSQILALGDGRAPPEHF
jgi:hypothetical protein